jgi:uncharacterized protein (DUF433 family)
MGSMEIRQIKADLERFGLGRGIYATDHASRLIGIRREKIIRWFRGGSRILEAEYDGAHRRTLCLSFLELLELRTIAFLRDNGISMQRCRKFADYVKECHNTKYPFAIEDFYTDGKELYVKFCEKDAPKKHLMRIRDKQTEMDAAVKEYLEKMLLPFRAQLDFENKEPFQWWPQGRDTPIVINPKIQMGNPVTSKSFLLTSVLAAQAKAGDPRSVADWYEIQVEEVEAAMRFEEGLNKAA